jgi:ammonia channel protein AmtB
VLKKPDLSMALNGILAGLVGITAGADQMSAMAGLHHRRPRRHASWFFSVLFLDKLKIDDPVGAMSVHLVCGIFGTLAVGIWGNLAAACPAHLPAEGYRQHRPLHLHLRLRRVLRAEEDDRHPGERRGGNRGSRHR